jgi:hypothetical protein
VTKNLFGTRDKQLLQEFPELDARQILKSIDLVDKKILAGFRSHYDALSEFCHPNSFGHRGLFSKIDQQTGITTFEMKGGDRFIVPIKAALGTAALFRQTTKSIGKDTVSLARAYHAVHPTPLPPSGTPSAD